MEYADSIQAKIEENKSKPLNRKDLGMFIREIAKESTLGTHWKLAFYFSLVVQLVRSTLKEYDQIIAEYVDVFERISAFHFEHVDELKPIVDVFFLKFTIKFSILGKDSCKMP